MNNTMTITVSGNRLFGDRSFAVNSSDMKAPLTEGALQQIWDKIADFFCGTHVVEAKQHLRDFFNEKKSPDEQAGSFTALMNLCSSACQQHFMITPDEGGEVRVDFETDGERLVTEQLKKLRDCILRDVLDAKKSERERAQSFTALRDLCSPACRDQFKITPAKEEGEVGVAFQIGNERFVTKDLRGVNLSKVNLTGVNLTGADLWNADLTDTNLTNAILTNANMEMVALNAGTNLHNATLPTKVPKEIVIGGLPVKTVTHPGSPFYRPQA